MVYKSSLNLPSQGFDPLIQMIDIVNVYSSKEIYLIHCGFTSCLLLLKECVSFSLRICLETLTIHCQIDKGIVEAVRVEVR